MDQPPDPDQTAPPSQPLPASNVQPPAPQPPAAYGYQPAPPPTPYGPQPVYVMRPPKSKTTAVLLAVFLSFFAWLYTYEKDSWKFWLNLTVWIVNVVLSFVTFGIWLVIAVPVGFGVWIWAIVDVAARPQYFYDQYPAA